MEELDLKELFNMFWVKKIQIILIVIIFMVIGVIYSLGFVTPKYTSSTTLVLATSIKSTNSNEAVSITTTDLTLNSKLVPTYSVLAKSKRVLSQVLSNLNITDVEESSLKNNVSVTSESNTDVIRISVTNENPTYAAKIANEIAKVFAEEVARTYNINNVHVVDEAEVESSPSNINHKKTVLMFTMLGIGIAIMYVIIINLLDTTIKTAEDVEKHMKVPVLASIPRYDTENEKVKNKRGGRR